MTDRNHAEISKRLNDVNLIGSITFVGGQPTQKAMSNINEIEDIFFAIMDKVNSLNVFDFDKFVNEIKNNDHTMFHQIEAEAISSICFDKNIKNIRHVQLKKIKSLFCKVFHKTRFAFIKIACFKAF